MGDSELNESKGHSAGGMLKLPDVHGLQTPVGPRVGPAEVVSLEFSSAVPPLAGPHGPPGTTPLHLCCGWW